jgi:hypothetical protein
MIKLETTTNLDINCSNEMQIVRNVAIEETYNITCLSATFLVTWIW